MDRTGAFLIDRTPEYFAPIIHFLRTGQVVLDKSLPVEAVLEEARFFNIAPLVELLEERLNVCPSLFFFCFTVCFCCFVYKQLC